MKLPSVRSLALALQPIKTIAKTDDTFVIVRVQVLEDGDWKLHTGDFQPEEDHEGFWGQDIVDEDSDLTSVAKDMIEEVTDHLIIHQLIK